MTRPPLLILGASARAAAASAARAGFAPTAVDLFADRDLAARFPSRRVDRGDYPAALADLATVLPRSPWIYTGGLENHPGLIDRIGRDRPLLGIGGEALRAVRDPSRWTEALRRAGLPALPCLEGDDPPPGSGSWMLKPRASASGHGMRAWTIGEGPIPERCYLQAVARGVPLGACFVGTEASARLVGVTRQFLGRVDRGPRVVYRGSVGPWPVSPGAWRAIRRVGETLAGAFGLRGLFGVDLMLDRVTVWVVEINPRYTASVEVLERALAVALMGEHVRAFGYGSLDRPGCNLPSPARGEAFLPPLEMSGPLPPCGGGPGWGVEAEMPTVAKRILRSRRHAVVPESWPWSDPLDPTPSVADIPAAGTILRPGDPVLTVFARGRGLDPAMARLKVRAARWRRRIDGWSA